MKVPIECLIDAERTARAAAVDRREPLYAYAYDSYVERKKKPVKKVTVIELSLI